MVILTSRSFANSHLRTVDKVVRVPANVVGQGKITSAYLFVWTTDGVFVVGVVVLIVDTNLA